MRFLLDSDILPGHPIFAVFVVISISMADMRFIVLVIIVLCSNFVEATTGFGSTIIAVTLGAHIYDIDFLVLSLVPLNILISIYIVARHWSALDKQELVRNIIPFAGAGLAVGIVLFNRLGVETLKIAYGAFVLSFSIFETVRIVRTKTGTGLKPLSRPASALWLIAGGIIQGIYASGGPMVVYYASRKLPDKTTFRSTLSGLWLVLNVAMFISHVATGKTDLDILKVSATLLPSLIIGIAVGEWVHTRIPEKTFRLFVFIILIVAGGALLLKGLQKYHYFLT